uniref:Ig-like domain-containing protein n=1 Tax=Paramormyrops kingsleyae TaxID=1676925 RepID=A0A3B3QAV9_9TELE
IKNFNPTVITLTIAFFLTQQPFSLDHAPRITVRMRSHRVPCGQNTKFTLNVQAKPEAEIRWFHNGEQIQESSKYHFTNMSGVLSLQVCDCQADDSGTYRVVCTNYKGEASDYGTLDVSVKASHTKLSLSEGQSVTLKANIPEASNVRWILNGKELANSADYRYGVSGNDHTLTIKMISQHEEGIITCEATTEHGIVKCQFDTTITSKRSNAPSFLVQPKSQNVNEGQNVIFTCEITGDPSPEIEWLKNNVLVRNYYYCYFLIVLNTRTTNINKYLTAIVFQVSLSSHLKLSRSKNVYTLEITEASISDSGKYTVKATNMYGQCSTTLYNYSPSSKDNRTKIKISQHFHFIFQ